MSATARSWMWFIATTALSAACVTAPHGEAGPQTPLVALEPPAPSPAPVVAAPQTLFGLARLAAFFEPVAPSLVDRVVRWQLDARDAVTSLQDRFTALAEAAGMTVPDLTVLAIEPVAHTESSGFGWRDDPIRHRRSFHSGTDFRGKPGTPVVAAGDGIVAFSGRLGGYGNVVDINHGGGVVTRYAHLRKIETRKDATITAGARIGQVGSTGRTTGPHLHFEVRLRGAPVSPIAALTVGELQRESPLAGRLAALALAPELQSIAQSDIDPPRQRARSQTDRPERVGRAKRRQVLW